MDVSGNLSWSQSTSTTAPTARNIKGPTGANGKTWRPTVDASGNISWAESTSTTAPTTQNIKGPTGPTGATGATGLNWAAGKMMHTDPTFAKGMNGCSKYANSNATNVTVERVNDTTFPNTSKYGLKITTTGATSPGCGGFVQSTNSAAGKIFILRIVAKIPEGYTLAYGNNSVGTGAVFTWYSAKAGTGKFEEYILKLKCGATGSFSSFGYWYLTGTAGTAAAPVVWYVAYATVFDMTDTDGYATQIADVKTLAESKASATALTTLQSTVSSNYNTLNAAIEERTKLSDVQPRWHFYEQTTRSGGYYKIKIKPKTAWMLAFTVRVYSGYKIRDILISGYNYSTTKTWHSPQAIFRNGEADTSVVFGQDGDRELWVAIPAGNYAGLDILEVSCGNQQVEFTKDLFTITYEAELTGTIVKELALSRPVTAADRTALQAEVKKHWKPTVSAAGEVTWALTDATSTPTSRNIKGPTGGTGDKGDPGEKGAKGDTGSPGTDGKTWLPSVNANGELSWSQSATTTAPTTRNIKGPTGANGKTWLPSVDASGNLTWSESTSTTAPTARNIKGPQGATGATGAAGASYTENLLPKSDVGASNDLYNITKYNLPEKPVAGKTYTFTVWGALAAAKASFTIYNSGGSVNLVTLKKIAEGVYSASFAWKSGTASNIDTYINVYAYPNTASGTSTIERVKFEEGANPAPVWTPAYEDLEGASCIQAKGDLSVTMANIFNIDVPGSAAWTIKNPGDFKAGDLAMLTVKVSDCPGFVFELIGSVVAVTGSGTSGTLTIANQSSRAVERPSIVMYQGVIASKPTIQTTGINSTSYDMVYCTATKTFIAYDRSSGKYYSAVPAENILMRYCADGSSTANGYVPRANTTYVNAGGSVSSHKGVVGAAAFFNGTALMNFAAQTSSQEVASTVNFGTVDKG